MGNIKKNIIYNLVYQLLILVLPLVTVPYVSRVLGASGVGTYSFTYSNSYYFIIFCMLGINNYGNRAIAQVRDSKDLLSKRFREIHSIQVVASITMLLLYILYLLFGNIEHKNIAILQTIHIISCLFDINWFFFGIEKFKITVIRNTVIKFLSLSLIFIFVNEKDDVWIYTLILAGSVLLSQIALWPFLKEYVYKVRLDFSNVKKHLQSCIKLFLPVIAVTIYKVMDKTMIGWFSDMSEVGYYENAEKIINVPNAIVSALGTVMLPRMSNLFANNNDEQSKTLIHKSIKVIMFVTFPMVLGLISISKDFTYVFFGSEYQKTGYIIAFLSVSILFFAWGNVIRTQYLIPKEYDNIYVKSAFLGAIINMLFNLIFIPQFASIGACVGTIFAEFAVVFYQTYMIKDELPIKLYIRDVLPFCVKAILMFVIIYPLNFIKMNMYISIIIQILLGAIIYFLFNLRFVDDIIGIKRFKNILLRRVKNEKN